jgi:hypothetical protein
MKIPKLEDFDNYMQYDIACKAAGVTPEPNPKLSLSIASAPTRSQPPVIKQQPAQQQTKGKSLGFDLDEAKTALGFDGWTPEQVETVYFYHVTYLPLFAKTPEDMWWSDKITSVSFFRKHFGTLAEAFPIGKLSLEQMQYAVKKKLEPPMEYDFDPNCPRGCQRGFIKEMQKVGRGHLPVIVRECECRRLVPVGTLMRKKQP